MVVAEDVGGWALEVDETRAGRRRLGAKLSLFLSRSVDHSFLLASQTGSCH